MNAPKNITGQDLERLHAEQASAWLEMQPHASPEQRIAFVAWLKESPRNVRDILLMMTLDQALEHMDAGHSHDVRALIAQVQGSVVAFPARREPAEAALGRPWPRRWAAMAAGIAIILGCGWFALSGRTAEWQVYQTATSEQRAFELGDGSVINLNTHSRIAVRLSRMGRDVRLIEGEALFRVRHDAARPFRVFTGDAVIEDLGTQFNVYHRPEGTVVAVLEGQISIAPVSQPAIHGAASVALAAAASEPPEAASHAPQRAIGANQVAEVSPVGVISVRTVSDVTDAISWRDRRLVFRQESLKRIVEEFNRYNSRQIRLEGPAVASRVYTGVFDADDVDSLAQVLARDTDLQIEKTEQGMVIRQR